MEQNKAIETIKNLPVTTDIGKFQLDNLDWAELVETEQGVMVENEHGKQFEVEELNEQELNIVIYLAGLHK